MSSELRWHGKEALAKAQGGMKRGLEAAAIVVLGETDNNIVTKNIIDTSHLRGSMTHEVKGDTATVGTNVEYAVYHEFGTSRMAARPFLRPAVDEHRAEIRKAFADQIRRALS